MAKHTNEPNEAALETAADVASAIPSSPDAPITTAQLMQFLTAFAANQNQSQSVLANAIVEGLKESARPYVDPKKEANEAMFREQARRIEEQRRSNERASQDHCPHIAGCNGLSTARDYQNRTCLIHHMLDSGETVLLCTNCQREIRSSDPDYHKWANMPSINTRSTGGQRDSYRTVVQLQKQLEEANRKLELQSEAIVNA